MQNYAQDRNWQQGPEWTNPGLESGWPVTCAAAGLSPAWGFGQKCNGLGVLRHSQGRSLSPSPKLVSAWREHHGGWNVVVCPCVGCGWAYGVDILRGLFLGKTPTPIVPVRTPASLASWDMSPLVIGPSSAKAEWMHSLKPPVYILSMTLVWYWCWICDLRRRRFSFGARDQAWSLLKSFCVAEFY